MAYEIERKFLVKGDFRPDVFKQYNIQQGYLILSGVDVVRVRIRDDKGFLTIKTAEEESSIRRNEWEYEVPLKDAKEMLALCQEGVIKKTRSLVRHGKHVFEVDEFYGENEGLLLAELELEHEDEPYGRPDWLGEEVTGNVRYFNSFLSVHPFKEWSEDEGDEE